MKVLCSKCGAVFDSVILDKELRIKQILQKLSEHALRKHNQNFQLLNKGLVKAVSCLSSLMLIDEFAVIPEDQTELQELHDDFEVIVMQSIGYDPDEIEDDDAVSDDEIEDSEEVTEVEVPTDTPQEPLDSQS